MICAGERTQLQESKIWKYFQLGLQEFRAIMETGDSGGPLVSRDSAGDSGYSLIGVLSFGDYCEGDSPLVAAEVSHFLPWIAKQYGLSLP